MRACNYAYFILVFGNIPLSDCIISMYLEARVYGNNNDYEQSTQIVQTNNQYRYTDNFLANLQNL